ncbi:hypothetical protein J6590_034227 [Homalodisca vitripennis]|nr:hypothetical protein J6590_034227 [Homalodisca vitripennis]
MPDLHGDKTEIRDMELKGIEIFCGEEYKSFESDYHVFVMSGNGPQGEHNSITHANGVQSVASSTGMQNKRRFAGPATLHEEASECKFDRSVADVISMSTIDPLHITRLSGEKPDGFTSRCVYFHTARFRPGEKNTTGQIEQKTFVLPSVSSAQRSDDHRLMGRLAFGYMGHLAGRTTRLRCGYSGTGRLQHGYAHTRAVTPVHIATTIDSSRGRHKILVENISDKAAVKEVTRGGGMALHHLRISLEHAPRHAVT